MLYKNRNHIILYSPFPDFVFRLCQYSQPVFHPTEKKFQHYQQCQAFLLRMLCKININPAGPCSLSAVFQDPLLRLCSKYSLYYKEQKNNLIDHLPRFWYDDTRFTQTGNMYTAISLIQI